MMKIEKIKKGKIFKCRFSHNWHEFYIGEKNKCDTQAKLIAELKRIKKAVDETHPPVEEDQIEEVELSQEEIDQILSLTLES